MRDMMWMSLRDYHHIFRLRAPLELQKNGFSAEHALELASWYCVQLEKRKPWYRQVDRQQQHCSF